MSEGVWSGGLRSESEAAASGQGLRSHQRQGEKDWGLSEHFLLSGGLAVDTIPVSSTSHEAARQTLMN